MGTYEIPRNYGGESKILYIFTVKSLITTAVGGGVGAIFWFLLKMLGLNLVGLILLAVFAVLGYVIGALKIPTVVGIPITKKIGGEPIGEILFRYIKFKKNRKMYSYTKEEK